MKILLISGLDDHGWWRGIIDPPKYYNFGALGDMFPGEVFYTSLLKFMDGAEYLARQDFDVVMVQQCKSPENFHIGVFKKVKAMFPAAKLVMFQEDDINAVCRMSPQGQIDHIYAIEDYVDLVYVHEDRRAQSFYSRVLNTDTKIFYTPFPVKWTQQFAIPHADREFDVLVTGSFSPQYAGIAAWLYFERQGYKTLATMCHRYDGFVPGTFLHVLPEMHWRDWIKAIASCKQYFISSPEVGSRSMEIACEALGMTNLGTRKLAMLVDLYDFQYAGDRIREELEDLIE